MGPEHQLFADCFQVSPPSEVSYRTWFPASQIVACLSSLASTPPRSAAIGVSTICQCLPRSLVRSRVPDPPAIQQILLDGAEPLVSLAGSGAFCVSQLLPPFLECAMAPFSPNRQIFFPSGATATDGSDFRLDTM